MGERYGIGVDLGGTRVRVGLVTAEGEVRHRVEAPTRRDAGAVGVLDQIADLVRAVRAHLPQPDEVAVGVAVPGPVNPQTGVVRFAPNLPGWKDLPVREALADRLHMEVRVGNDANLAALGEHRFGAGRGFRHFLYVTVSTGVGGGIIVDDRLLLGAHGYAAEIGHHTVLENGPRCACGNIGCLEALASGTAIAREARVAVASGQGTRLREMCGGDIWRLDAAMVVQAAAAGDAVAAGILEQAGHYLGVGLLNLIHIFNPERIVLGGGVMRAGEWITRPMWAVLRSRVHPGYLEGLDIVPPALGDNAGLLGAAVLALEA